MCGKKENPKVLTKEDFIIPENWEPTSPSLKRIIERRERIVAMLGPALVKEILEEFGVEYDEEEFSDGNSDNS